MGYDNELLNKINTLVSIPVIASGGAGKLQHFLDALIKGKADAEAANIYASAYNKDASFYRFMRTMEIYRETLDKETVLVLSTDGEFLKYLVSTK